MLEFLLKLIQIFVTYVITLLGIPVAYVGLLISAVALVVAAILVLLIVLAVGFITWLFVAPVWYLGGPIVRRIGWAMYLWLGWANRYWYYLMFPPMTTVIWWVPGVVFVPIVGSLIATILEIHFLLGFLLGLALYDIGILWLIQLGARYDYDRWRASIDMTTGG